ncbi:MAG TPA: FAD-dependent oxidoreductase, partial [Gemmatimonadaceae bacterium]|nr:FAD-dependent oxidoreductase [Gemmatimonadaceae bacterium]
MLGRAGKQVLLVEREAQLMTRASLNNQARVHAGYHYPRSILTSLRSRLNYPRFLAEYADCIDQSFPHYYAVGRELSKVTGAQFAAFCERIEAPLRVAPRAVAELFDSNRIDAVFEVEECAFDAARLRARLTAELEAVGVEVWLRTNAARVQRSAGGARVSLHRRAEPVEVETPLVLNCTYAALNGLLKASGASGLSMKHEMTEMALVT